MASKIKSKVQWLTLKKNPFENYSKGLGIL
jgi:hypothetical protein